MAQIDILLKELDVEKEKKKRDYQRKKELKEKRKLEKRVHN
jgi:hypothetical protein